MYTAQQVVEQSRPSSGRRIWQEKIACFEVNNQDIYSSEDSLMVSAYSLLLILEGELSLIYNERSMSLGAGDLHIYAPGMATRIIGASPDYRAWIIIIDEDFVRGQALMQDYNKLAYFPIMEFNKPQLHLSTEQSRFVLALMQVIHQQTEATDFYQGESLRALCLSLCYTLLSYQQRLIDAHRAPSRAEELFYTFLRLVAEHYIEHRELSYYAERLHITTIYLSRIVKAISGRTVRSFIDHELAREASRRIKTGQDSLSQIAFDLGFAELSSFSKFFTRLRGISPRQYRQQTLQ